MAAPAPRGPPTTVSAARVAGAPVLAASRPPARDQHPDSRVIREGELVAQTPSTTVRTPARTSTVLMQAPRATAGSSVTAGIRSAVRAAPAAPPLPSFSQLSWTAGMKGFSRGLGIQSGAPAPPLLPTSSAPGGMQRNDRQAYLHFGIMNEKTHLLLAVLAPHPAALSCIFRWSAETRTSMFATAGSRVLHDIYLIPLHSLYRLQRRRQQPRRRHSCQRRRRPQTARAIPARKAAAPEKQTASAGRPPGGTAARRHSAGCRRRWGCRPRASLGSSPLTAAPQSGAACTPA